MYAAAELTKVMQELPGEAALSPNVRLEWGPYLVRLAANEEERAAAFRLRLRVFKLELNDGLESAYKTGHDTDRYDAACDHLIVQQRGSREVVGTYRLQMGDVAQRHHGYYSEQEFDCSPFEAIRTQTVELGRACIDKTHRSSEVLHLLWRGIARYVLAKQGRYMLGCCSLPSLNCAYGHAVYQALRGYMAPPSLQTTSHPAFTLPPGSESMEDSRPPKLLRAYLTIGAKICSKPAIDREFKTIDFLTLLDLQSLHPRMATRFLEDA